MKKPAKEDFGLTDQEYTSLVAERDQINEAINKQPAYGILGQVIGAVYISLIVGGVVWMTFNIISFFLLSDSQLSYIVFLGGSLCFLIFALNYILNGNKKRTQYNERLSDSKFHKVAQYEEAISRYEKTQHTYWKSLRGTKFERALANLYKKMGYSVQQTKASGDEGIDLILSKEDKTTVVQCKGYAKPIGISAARDLYGTMIHCKADSAVLACPAGFTKVVENFVTDKPIQLISADDLVMMSTNNF